MECDLVMNVTLSPIATRHEEGQSMKMPRWIRNLGSRLTTIMAPLTTADRVGLAHSAMPDARITRGIPSPAEPDRLARIATLLTADTDARLHRIAALLTTDIDA